MTDKSKPRLKINNTGNLLIERAGVFKAQACPYGREDTPCGDWCPLFQEEEGNINLCETMYFYSELIDERIEDNESS